MAVKLLAKSSVFVETLKPFTFKMKPFNRPESAEILYIIVQNLHEVTRL